MSDHDWKKPWLNAVRFLNVVAAHTVAAFALVFLLVSGEYALDRYSHAKETKWLAGTAHEFTAADLLHSSDLAIILLFVGFGIFHGFEELRK